MDAGRLSAQLLHTIPSPGDVYRLTELLAKAGARTSIVGWSCEGRPIHAVEAGEGEYRVLVVSGIHGNEPAPVSASLVLLQQLVMKRPLNPYYQLNLITQKVKVVVVPLANPDGFANYYSSGAWKRPGWDAAHEVGRLNGGYMDVNRDWVLLSQPETRALHKLLNTFKPHAVVELHEFYARGGSPPRWADETEGFMATLTDTPYAWAPRPVRETSRRLMVEAAKAIEASTGWKVKSRHFTGTPGGEGEREELVWAPPIFMGVHVAIECTPRILVETWGIGLGVMLYQERVRAHLEAVLAVLDYVAREGESLVTAVEEARREDASTSTATYVLRGPGIREAVEILEAHGIDVRAGDESTTVKLPQPGRTRMALILLDEECTYNTELRKRRRGPYTLTRLIPQELRVEKED